MTVTFILEPIVGKDDIEYGYLKRSPASDKYEIFFTKEKTEKKRSLCRTSASTAKEHENDVDDSGTAKLHFFTQ